MLDFATRNGQAADLIGRLGDLIHIRMKDLVVPEAPVALLDFPDIRNCGDSAIWLGEMAWLRTRFDKVPSYVSRTHDLDESELRAAAPQGTIFFAWWRVVR
jgi:pyruvyl transferase EpsO